MLKIINIHMYDIKGGDQFRALRCAEKFGSDYPDRTGLRDCVIYSNGNVGDALCVYRTQGGRIIVRGQG